MFIRVWNFVLPLHCASSQKIGRRTEHSRKIVPGLEAWASRYDAKPGPERSEGPASHAGSEVQREPDHSEGAASQKIGRELEAFHALPER